MRIYNATFERLKYKVPVGRELSLGVVGCRRKYRTNWYRVLPVCQKSDYGSNSSEYSARFADRKSVV
jgi:hypothetical protein